MEFRGYQCDDCGVIVTKDEVHHVVCRIDGPTVSGEYGKQLCAACAQKCIPDGAELRPLRRRAPRAAASPEATHEGVAAAHR